MHRTNYLILLSAIFQAVRMMTGATSTLYLIDKGILEGEIAALRTLQFFVIVSTDSLLGYLADKYGRRLFLLLSILFSSCWLFITSVGSNTHLLYLGEVFNALSIATGSGVFISLLIDAYKIEQRSSIDVTKIISRHCLVVSLGMIVGVIVGSFFSLDQLDRLWLLASCLCVLVLPFAFFLTSTNYYNRLPRAPKLRHHSLWMYTLKKDVQDLKKIFYINKIIPSFLISTLSSALFRVLISYTPLVTRLNIPNYSNSYVHALILVLMLLAQSLAGYVIKLFNKSFLLIICTVLITLLTLITCSVPSSINVASWITLSGLLMSLIVCTSGYIHNRISDEFRATFDSLLNTVSTLSSMVLSWIIYTQYTSIYFIYKFSFSVCCIASVFAIYHGYQHRVIKTT